jgi:hypothetical protein
LHDKDGTTMVETEVITSKEPQRATDSCPVEWGNCGENPIFWGKPSTTPHRCGGKATHIRRGIAKIHICEKCKSLGSHVKPSPYSKAGAQIRKAILVNEGFNEYGVPLCPAS